VDLYVFVSAVLENDVEDRWTESGKNEYVLREGGKEYPSYNKTKES
jgi:hypothetical protein